jgi:hypothetical protein
MTSFGLVIGLNIHTTNEQHEMDTLAPQSPSPVTRIRLLPRGARGILQMCLHRRIVRPSE